MSVHTDGQDNSSVPPKLSLQGVQQKSHYTCPYLVNMIEIASFLGPVPITHGLTIFCQASQHHYDNATLFPHHLTNEVF